MENSTSKRYKCLGGLQDGQCVGGVGVSGVQSHEDEQIAKAGIAALGQD